jgi:hypothetical protein
MRYDPGPAPQARFRFHVRRFSAEHGECRAVSPSNVWSASGLFGVEGHAWINFYQSRPALRTGAGGCWYDAGFVEASVRACLVFCLLTDGRTADECQAANQTDKFRLPYARRKMKLPSGFFYSHHPKAGDGTRMQPRPIYIHLLYGSHMERTEAVAEIRRPPKIPVKLQNTQSRSPVSSV